MEVNLLLFNFINNTILQIIIYLTKKKSLHSELIQKANVNLALFELIAENREPIGKIMQVLSNELKKLYAGSSSANR